MWKKLQTIYLGTSQDDIGSEIVSVFMQKESDVSDTDVCMQQDCRPCEGDFNNLARKTSFAVYHFVYLVDCIYKTGLVDKEEIQLTTHDFID